MGLGDFPCGGSPCGHDALPPPVPPRTTQPPVALRYDGATKDFLKDDSGRYLEVHPVDQEVALALCVGLGTLPSVPGAGAAFRKIKRITNSTPNLASDMAKAALSDLVRAGKIQIQSIAAETRVPPGATLIAVTYVNLVTKKQGGVTTSSSGTATITSSSG